jgi:hypothetical protein
MMSTPNLTAQHPDDKPETVMVELAQLDDDHKLAGQSDVTDATPVSPLKDLPRRKSLFVYKKAIIISVMIAWSSIMDGYLVSSACAA